MPRAQRGIVNAGSEARKYTRAALSTLHGIMTNPQCADAARVAAANAILDRGHGKPKQEVEHNINNDLLAALREIRERRERMIEPPDDAPMIDVTPALEGAESGPEGHGGVDDARQPGDGTHDDSPAETKG